MGVPAHQWVNLVFGLGLIDNKLLAAWLEVVPELADLAPPPQKKRKPDYLHDTA